MMNEIKINSLDKIVNVNTGKILYTESHRVEPETTVVIINNAELVREVVNSGGRIYDNVLIHDTINIQNRTKLFMIIFLIIFSFPITFCDLYYANAYKKCLSQTNEAMEISMYEYLIGNGIYSCIALLMSVGIIFMINIQNNNIIFDNYLFKMIGKISGYFYILWTCIGAIIFWRYLNKHNCSDDIINYLKISIIIKLIFTFIQIVTNNPMS